MPGTFILMARSYPHHSFLIPSHLRKISGRCNDASFVQIIPLTIHSKYIIPAPYHPTGTLPYYNKYPA